MGKITAHLKNILGVTTFTQEICTFATKFMHHRKQFWEYFSFLLGRDAKLCKMKESVFFAKYDEMIEFLLK